MVVYLEFLFGVELLVELLFMVWTLIRNDEKLLGVKIETLLDIANSYLIN
ncbi:hypothetical protein pCXcHC2016_26 [Xenohaliotis phage pCXc-HC2016]|nr:hypothetical protein pCXcHC2016_26 [Xenohaliotis phage pCXc-HC2016]AQW89133.1 hypothetical protein pCXcHR2015_26 [Xenohaliotis phage pCXc-HR2015]